jgi:endonuclease YncB( thermonuclease family)
MVRFARQRKPWSRVPWRLRRAPWQPLAALVGVAGALWFAAEVDPHVIAGNGALGPSGNGPLAHANVVDGHGRFVLCIGAQQQSCVVDGDTIRYGGVRIRLADIDAPEVFSPQCASEAVLGRRATERLLELINAGPFEVVQRGRRDEDRYGRKLRVIARDGRSLGATLVAEGLARPWDGARRSWCG